MGSIIGQVGFGQKALDSSYFRASLLCDFSRTPPRPVCETPTLCLAQGGAGGAFAGPVSVALDGQLHGQADLAAALSALDDEAGGSGDPALIAAAWQRWGAEAPTHLQGDYAFALQDVQADQALLVRDHIGTRPLHWHWDGTRLSFATFLPALLALLQESPGPDEETVAAFLRWPTALNGRTFFAGVHALEPGCAVTVDAAGPRVTRWWRPEQAPDVRYRDWRDYAQAFRALTEQAVRDRVPEGAAIGAHLSGGVDSTLVALAAQEALAESGRGLTGAYSWSPPVTETDPEIEHDERVRIAGICAAAGLTPRYSTKTGPGQRAFHSRAFELEGLADVADEFPVLAQAEADGARRLLSGWGGDEAVSAHGLGVPAALLKRGRPGAALGLIRRINRGFRPLARSGRLLWRNTLLPLLPDALYNRMPYYADYYGNGCHISPRLAALPLDTRAFRRYRITGEPATDMAIHLSMGHIGERMATWAAWSAPHCIEYRYPLTDRRLLEFVLGVPPEILWGDGRPRYLARAALAGRTAVGVGKSDPANERQRLRAFRECWRLLAAEVADGAFDGTCDWLDMESLRRDVSRGPSGDDQADLLTLMRMMPAIRVWHMAERFGAVSRPPRRKAG